MSRTRIKFCGMTRGADIEAAAALGIDAIGLILAERSPRRLSLAQARALRRAVPPFVAAVVLTMDAEPAATAEATRVLRPDYLQFHGIETDPDCAAPGIPFLKALPMADGDDVAGAMARYPHAAGFVLDGHASGEAGGRGRGFDWARVPRALPRPWLLAGGLHPDNVFDAIMACRPYAVDVASGIESSAGIKCRDRMARFVAAVRRADAELASRDPA